MRKENKKPPLVVTSGRSVLGSETFKLELDGLGETERPN
jgi:hypothetical protein